MTDYYVDGTGAGNNLNNGLSYSAAWAAPPGLGHNKTLYPGDVVHIKPGSGWSGLWELSSGTGYGGGGTRSNPIATIVDRIWPGAAPDAQVTLTGAIYVAQDGIKIDGISGDLGSNDQPVGYGLVVRNNAGFSSRTDTAFIAVDVDEINLRHILFTAYNGSSPNCGYAIFQPRGVRSSEFRYIFLDNQNSDQHITGFEMDRGTSYDVLFDHCYAARFGPASGPVMSGNDNYWIGFHSTDIRGPITLNYCQFFANAARACDIGGLNGQSGDWIFNYCQARNNRVSGWGVSGESPNIGYDPRIYFNYCIARDCADYGWKIYEVGGTVHINNCIACRNDVGVLFYADGPAGDDWLTLHIKNSAFFNNNVDLEYCELTESTSYNGVYPGMRGAYINNNAYWGSSNFVRLPAREFGASPYITYTSAHPGDPNGWWAQWSQTKLGMKCDLASVSSWMSGFKASMVNIAANDFHLNPDSWLIDRGTTDFSQHPPTG